MSSKSKTLDAELMDPGMTGNVTPAKKGSERENDTTQQEKKSKLTIHEKPPTETSQQLINVPGNEVEQPKAVRGDDTSSEIVEEGPEEGPGYCMIHDCNADDHSTFTYPDREKYLVLYDGVYILNFYNICGFGHLGIDCPQNADDFNFD